MATGGSSRPGPPAEVVTAELVEDVFDLPCRIIEDPVSGTPLVLPLVGTPADPARGGR